VRPWPGLSCDRHCSLAVLLVLLGLLVRPLLQRFPNGVDSVYALLHRKRTKKEGPRRRGPWHV
jgi:hypothetical protein